MRAVNILSLFLFVFGFNVYATPKEDLLPLQVNKKIVIKERAISPNKSYEPLLNATKELGRITQDILKGVNKGIKIHAAMDCTITISPNEKSKSQIKEHDEEWEKKCFTHLLNHGIQVKQKLTEKQVEFCENYEKIKKVEKDIRQNKMKIIGLKYGQSKLMEKLK